VDHFIYTRTKPVGVLASIGGDLNRASNKENIMVDHQVKVRNNCTADHISCVEIRERI